MFNINIPLLFKVIVFSYMFQSLRMAWRRTLNNINRSWTNQKLLNINIRLSRFYQV